MSTWEVQICPHGFRTTQNDKGFLSVNECFVLMLMNWCPWMWNFKEETRKLCMCMGSNGVQFLVIPEKCPLSGSLGMGTWQLVNSESWPHSFFDNLAVSLKLGLVISPVSDLLVWNQMASNQTHWIAFVLDPQPSTQWLRGRHRMSVDHQIWVTHKTKIFFLDWCTQHEWTSTHCVWINVSCANDTGPAGDSFGRHVHCTSQWILTSKFWGAWNFGVIWLWVRSCLFEKVWMSNHSGSTSATHVRMKAEVSKSVRHFQRIGRKQGSHGCEHFPPKCAIQSSVGIQPWSKVCCQFDQLLEDLCWEDWLENQLEDHLDKVRESNGKTVDNLQAWVAVQITFLFKIHKQICDIFFDCQNCKLDESTNLVLDMHWPSINQCWWNNLILSFFTTVLLADFVWRHLSQCASSTENQSLHAMPFVILIKKTAHTDCLNFVWSVLVFEWFVTAVIGSWVVCFVVLRALIYRCIPLFFMTTSMP